MCRWMATAQCYAATFLIYCKRYVAAITKSQQSHPPAQYFYFSNTAYAASALYKVQENITNS